ncbi:MAG: PEP-CTERM sorting domain-containing protein [Sedimentisphaerales bacterium]|nr:PEP-CTERM sorting domain-containing protein [Sedimentisphaerales bacterium]
MKKTKVILISVTVILAASLPTLAGVIYPNDDVTLRGSTNYNASAPFGLFVKNSGDVSYMEFELGITEALEATLTLHNDDAGVTNPWEIVVRGDEFSFDETTFTGTDVSSWTRVGTIPHVVDVAFYTLNLTDFYNDNLGKTITLHLGRDVQPSGSGPIFEDREGTKTGDALMYGPRIDVTPVPEPSCLLLLSFGAGLLARRRQAR